MTYTLSSVQYAKALAMLKASGVDITGNSGEIENSGIRLGYEYQEPNLTISIIRKPFYMPTHVIKDKLDSWFGAL